MFNGGSHYSNSNSFSAVMDVRQFATMPWWFRHQIPHIPAQLGGLLAR